MTRSRRARATSLVLAVALAPALIAGSCRAPRTDVVLVGTVERTLVELSAPVPEALAELRCERGQHVRAGDVLARLDGTVLRAELAAGEAALVGARSRVLLADQEWERARQLGRADVASRQTLDRAGLERALSRAQEHEVQARLVALQKRFVDLELRAPVDGVVDQIPFDRGERVPAGAVVVVLLADGAPWVRVWLPERALAQVGPGTPATVRVDAVDETLDARVLDVGREPAFTPHYALTERERGHLVYETRVELVGARAQRLRPGLPAQVTIALAGAPAETSGATEPARAAP